jgi:hypothetical protein
LARLGAFHPAAELLKPEFNIQPGKERWGRRVQLDSDGKLFCPNSIQAEADHPRSGRKVSHSNFLQCATSASEKWNEEQKNSWSRVDLAHYRSTTLWREIRGM